MEPKPYVLLEWLTQKSLRGFLIMSGAEGTYVVLNNHIADEFIQYLTTTSLINRCNNNKLIVCLICGGPFVLSGDLCRCYQQTPDCYNLHFFVSSQLVLDVESALKGIKNTQISKRLRSARGMACGSYNTKDLEIIYKLQAGLCYYCMCPIHTSGDKYSVDHIIPLSSSGTHWPTNIALTCKSCNSKKSWASEKAFNQKIRSAKTDKWVQEHKEFISYIKRHKRKVFANRSGV